MKKFIIGFLTVLALFYAISAECRAKKSADIKGWKLVWEDEFENNTIDESKWRVENAALFKNHELQYYAPDDVILKNGFLVLRSQKRSMKGREYTSGLVETQGKFKQAYGRFEIRAKLPKGQGIWPAHWLMNAVGQWPPEIDIMELKGNEPHKIHMTNHYGKWPDNKHEGKDFVGPDFSKNFHTFAIEWEPDEIRWYIDGVKRFSTRKNVPAVPFYIVLNTAVGGDWPGNPDKTTKFPQYHEIDYVRVYSKLK
jgi:beta-glucanase (GH16 family)